MRKKIELAIQLAHNMGARYVIYRVFHELEKRIGVLKKKHPLAPPKKEFISLANWRDIQNESIQLPIFVELSTNELESLSSNANNIFNGKIKFFNREWKYLGLDYDWITNPDTDFKYNISLHWSKISDFNRQNGDIKYVWEKSRFSYLLTIMRYDYHFKKDSSGFVFDEIESWIDSNPINQGPNWKCSQEISLRLFNWFILLQYYKDSNKLTENRWNKLQNTIFWSIHHVFHHINFSRIAVRNNHAITETLLLALSEYMFPFIPETREWAKQGRTWFEQEIKYQIYEDGTFLQFSMNYHRVVIQLLSLGITISENNNQPFSKIVYNRAFASLDFLYQCLQEENGLLPNYGSNDGALFFPFSNYDYRDYRPQLDHLHFVLTGQSLFNTPYEDQFWIRPNLINKVHYMGLTKKMGMLSYPNGGFYLLRENNSFTFIRCGKHKDRPAHADNLHLDIWINGENVLMDSGTYKYNADPEDVDYFTGTKAHNTVSVSNKSQMLKGSRFIWYFWSQARTANWFENESQYIFTGSIKAFGHISKNIEHHREVIKVKNQNCWIVKDVLLNTNGQTARQIWHSASLNKLSIANLDNINASSIVSYESSYYGEKIDNQGICFEFKDEIITKIEFNEN